MTTRQDLAELVCRRKACRGGGRSGLGLPPLHAPGYNNPFIVCEE